MFHEHMKSVTEALSANIKQLRAERGFSQEGLALRASVDRTVLSRIERRIANPSLLVLARIACALHVPLSTLIRAGNNAAPEPSESGANTNRDQS